MHVAVDEAVAVDDLRHILLSICTIRSSSEPHVQVEADRRHEAPSWLVREFIYLSNCETCVSNT